MENPDVTVKSENSPNAGEPGETEIDANFGDDFTEDNTIRLLEILTTFDPLTIYWDKIADFVLDKISIWELVKIKAQKTFDNFEESPKVESLIKLIIDNLSLELNKLSDNFVVKPEQVKVEIQEYVLNESATLQNHKRKQSLQDRSWQDEVDAEDAYYDDAFDEYSDEDYVKPSKRSRVSVTNFSLFWCQMAQC